MSGFPPLPPCGPVVVVDAAYDQCNMQYILTYCNIMIFSLYILYHAIAYAIIYDILYIINMLLFYNIVILYYIIYHITLYAIFYAI